jgi:Sec7-like guanine-nucleotide exchange factor
MKLQDFSNMIRGINDGENLDNDHIKEMYMSVAKE